MKKILFIFVLFLIACGKSKDDTETKMSDCIGIKVEKFKTEPRLKNSSSVSEYSLNQKLYYHFDYGGIADRPTYLLDNQCDTICTSAYLYGTKCKIDNFFQKATKVKVVFE
jgi:hypothetical protein